MTDHQPAFTPDINSSSQWHSIRPWSSRFVLSVREITSVSATFILSSLSVESNPSLASFGLSSSSDDEDSAENTHFISETLNKSLSVNVNSAPWKRSIVRVDDECDEAIILLYGLMPGRQYDIELGITTSEGEELIGTQMETQPDSSLVHVPSDKSEVSDASALSTISSVVSSHPYAPANQNGVPVPKPLTVDEQSIQLKQQLSLLSAEQLSLTSQLKAARKDSQKADASLRSEIEGLKRAAEKFAPTEHRNRQKVLALQEAVKQTLAATTETEQHFKDLEAMLPEVKKKEREAAKDQKALNEEVQRCQQQCDEAIHSDKRRLSELQNDLAAMTTRLEKLNMKRDKLVDESIPDSEEQLSRLRQEIEQVKQASNDIEFEVADHGSPVNFDHLSRGQQNFNMLSRLGPRYVHPPAPIGSQRPAQQHHMQPLVPFANIGARPQASKPSAQKPTRTPPNSVAPRAQTFDQSRISHRSFGSVPQMFPPLLTPSSMDLQHGKYRNGRPSPPSPPPLSPSTGTSLTPDTSSQSSGTRPVSPMRQTSLPTQLPSSTAPPPFKK